MFSHGREDVVAGRPGSIGVPEGDITPLPIPLIPHLTDNEAGIVDTAECLSCTTQDVGLPPLHIDVQEPEGLYLVQNKSKYVMAETAGAILIFFSFSASYMSSLNPPYSYYDESESLSNLYGAASFPPLTSK